MFRHLIYKIIYILKIGILNLQWCKRQFNKILQKVNIYDTRKKIYLLYTMDFETFINKYSFVNYKFVKDFYNIIKKNYIKKMVGNSK